MQVNHLKKADYAVLRWSGGTTTEIGIMPVGAVYAERNFLWRISTASVDLEVSDFTPLGGYRRWIATLTGNMTLTHDGGCEHVLAPFEIHTFDGGAATRSQGRCTDFNLTLRKGEADGTLYSVKLSAGQKQDISLSCQTDFSSPLLVIFCAEGSVSISSPEETLVLDTFDSAKILGMESGSISVSAEKDAALMVAEIWT